MSAAAERKRLLVAVLTYHWPTADYRCACGWKGPGAHAAHVADMYECALIGAEVAP